MKHSRGDLKSIGLNWWGVPINGKI